MPYDDYDPDKPVWWDWLQEKEDAVKEALDKTPTSGDRSRYLASAVMDGLSGVIRPFSKSITGGGPEDEQ